MGYTILLQWTFTPPSRHPLTDIILTRVLEHYQLQYSYRTNIQFRTFRAQAKHLTVVQYVPQSRPDSVSTNREDIAYLVLDDRNFKPGESSKMNGELSGKGKEKDQPGGGGEELETGTQALKDETITIEDEDEVKIIEPPSIEKAGLEDEARGPDTTTRPGKRKRDKERQQYQTLAVRPAGAVIPMLHNMLNPFVMGVTKSARLAASTTAQQAMPTSLPGTQVIIQSYNFPPLTTPHPAITLIVHSMPPNSNTIILEAELSEANGTESREVTETILKEFLEGCIPDGAGGDRRWGIWPTASTDDEGTGRDKTRGWEGTERIRRSTQMLTTLMRESSVV